MSAFVIGIPAPEGLDPKTYRVRVVVDRVDGAELTSDDLVRIEAVYPSKPARRRPEIERSATAPRATKPARKSSRTA